MNRDRIQGHFRQMLGSIKEQWGRVIDDQTMQVSGKRDRLVGRIQIGYGLTREAYTKEERGSRVATR